MALEKSYQAPDLDDDEIAALNAGLGVAIPGDKSPVEAPAEPATSPATVPAEQAAPATISASDFAAERGRREAAERENAELRARKSNDEFTADRLNALKKDAEQVPVLQKTLDELRAQLLAAETQKAVDPQWKDALGDGVYEAVDGVAKANARTLIEAELKKLSPSMNADQVAAVVQSTLEARDTKAKESAFYDTLTSAATGLPEAFKTHADPAFHAWLQQDPDFRLSVYNAAAQSKDPTRAPSMVRLQKEFLTGVKAPPATAVQAPASTATTATSRPPTVMTQKEALMEWNRLQDTGDFEAAAAFKLKYKEHIQ